MTTTTPSQNTWSLAEAVELCRAIHLICPKFGCHVGLTGGTLYKPGRRKDCDLIFYRIRQVEAINIEGLLDALKPLGVEPIRYIGWLIKAEYQGKAIDMFFPEMPGDIYDEPPEAIQCDEFDML